MQGFEPKPETKNLSGLFAASLQVRLMKTVSRARCRAAAEMGYVRSIQQSGSMGKGPKGPMHTQWKGAPGSAKGRGKGKDAMPAMPGPSVAAWSNTTRQTVL